MIKRNLIVAGIVISMALSAIIFRKNIKLFIVLSGSMEPTIKTGSLIFVRAEPNYQKNDIITFNNNQKISTTHRIIEIKNIDNKNIFTTKGDANNVADFKEINQDKIIGKKLFSIPYLGYLINFTQKITPTKSYFIDQKQISDNSFSSFESIISNSNIINSDSVSKEKLIQINYQTENDQNLDYVQLCYSFNLNPVFECPNLNSFKSNSGYFNFQSDKDGIYQFYTIAYDKNKNHENKTDLDLGTYQVLIDTENPFTFLSLGEYNPPAINSPIVIGWQTSEPTGDAVDKFSQTVSVPNTPTTLSFWYQFVSNDISDFDWFELNISDTNVLKIGNNTGLIEYDSGWQQFTYNLDQWLGQDTEISFEIHNHQDLKTYILIDEIKITNSDNLIDLDAPIILNTYDSTSGICQTFYQINDLGIKEYTNPFTLNSEGISIGQTISLSYFSQDNATNIGTSNSINLIASIIGQPASMSATIQNLGNNKILVLINNISKYFGDSQNDKIDYEITYLNKDIEKGIFSSINKTEIVNNNFSRELYLGTCSSGGACSPDNISVGSTILMSITGQISNEIITPIIKNIIYN
ncbi:MAG: signal peptidase I [Candidatus Shapirobacteria bacterium]